MATEHGFGEPHTAEHVQADPPWKVPFAECLPTVRSQTMELAAVRVVVVC